MKNKFSILFLSCALMSPLTLLAQGHDDHRYYDKQHKDYHNWDAHEDRAYHMYWEQRHGKYVSFDTLNANQQAAYWAWRHNHSDAILKIDIR